MPGSYTKLFHGTSNKLQTTNTGVVVTGILTATSNVNVGSGITLSSDGDIFAVGVSTFKDDINLPDNVELKLGSAGEVRLFHSGVDTKFIMSQHYFNMQANGYNFLSQNGSETLFTAFQNGAVSLFFDNTKRFETTNTGITVTGTTVPDGADINGDLDVSGTATLGSGGSGEAVLQYQGSTKLSTKTWGLQSSGTIQAIGDLEAANTSSQTDGKKINIKNLKSGGGVKNVLTLRLHESNNSSITGHVGNISINAPQVSISTHFSVAGVSTFNGLVKLPDSSDNQTGRIMFGDGTDLQMFHTGSAGEIGNFTGNLNVKSNSFRVFNGAANQVYIKADQNDSVILYHSNNEKFRTTNTGAVVTGILTATTSSVTLELTVHLQLVLFHLIT